MFNRDKLGKVAYEKRITWLYFAIVPILCAIALALSFNYKQPGLFYLSPVFDVFAVLFIVTFSKFFACNIYFNLVDKYNASVTANDVVVMRSGAPGTGKTSSQAYEVMQLAQMMWVDIQYKYKLYRGEVRRWRAEGNVKMLVRWEEIKFSYRFYNRHIRTHIPCLWSTLKLELDGRTSYDLTLDYLMQLRRLPGYSVLNHDDSGAGLGAQLSGEAPPELDRFMRYVRHFGFVLRTNDQRATNLFIGGRSVIACNVVMLKQVSVCQAQILMYLKQLLMPRLLALPDDTSNVHSRFTRFMSMLDELINFIGFRKYSTMSVGGTESEVNLPTTKQTYYLPRGLNCNYDDRAYMLCYEALNKKVDEPVYNPVLYVDPKSYAKDNALIQARYEVKLKDKPKSEVKQIPVNKDKPRTTRPERRQLLTDEIITALKDVLRHSDNTQGK